MWSLDGSSVCSPTTKSSHSEKTTMEVDVPNKHVFLVSPLSQQKQIDEWETHRQMTRYTKKGLKQRLDGWMDRNQPKTKLCCVVSHTYLTPISIGKLGNWLRRWLMFAYSLFDFFFLVIMLVDPINFFSPQSCCVGDHNLVFLKNCLFLFLCDVCVSSLCLCLLFACCCCCWVRSKHNFFSLSWCFDIW